jgi:hypothetical protein
MGAKADSYELRLKDRFIFFVMLNLFQHPPRDKRDLSGGRVDPETSSG